MRARQIIAERNRRESLFPGMGEPAWMMLVDLYANDGRGISVTSACLASFAPATTALRYVCELEAGGLIVRAADDTDRRRFFLRLTSEARTRLDHYFDVRARPETPRDCGPGAKPFGVGAASFAPFHATADATGAQRDHG